MKSKIALIGIAVLLFSCNGKDDQSVIGRYMNTFEADAEHYVELKADSTYFHYYKKGENPAKENKGTWRLSIRRKKTEIILNTWIDFGYIDQPACIGCLRAVKLEEGEMIFNVDLPNEMNFRKQELSRPKKSLQF